MKVMQYDPKTEQYTLVREVGTLKNFNDECLLSQILNAMELLKPSWYMQEVLVLDPEECERVQCFAQMLANGQLSNRGPGHKLPSWSDVFSLLIRTIGYMPRSVPEDGNAARNPADVTKWLLGVGFS